VAVSHCPVGSDGTAASVRLWRLLSASGLNVRPIVLQITSSKRNACMLACYKEVIIPDGGTIDSDVNGSGSELCDSQSLIKGGGDDGVGAWIELGL
jgi:hypothetical protein